MCNRFVKYKLHLVMGSARDDLSYIYYNNNNGHRHKPVHENENVRVCKNVLYVILHKNNTLCAAFLKGVIKVRAKYLKVLIFNQN